MPPVFPVYPLTSGVESWDLQRVVRFAREVVEIEDAIPESVRTAYSLLDLRSAYDQIHAPADFGQVQTAQRRFRFEEALTLQLVMGRRRRALLAQGAKARTGGRSLLSVFDSRLPFELTTGQKSVGAKIEHDLA